MEVITLDPVISFNVRDLKGLFQVSGQKVKIGEFLFGVHRDILGTAAVHATELSTGCYVAKGRSAEEAIEGASSKIASMGTDAFKDAIASYLEKNERANASE